MPARMRNEKSIGDGFIGLCFKMKGVSIAGRPVTSLLLKTFAFAHFDEDTGRMETQTKLDQFWMVHTTPFPLWPITKLDIRKNLCTSSQKLSSEAPVFRSCNAFISRCSTFLERTTIFHGAPPEFDYFRSVLKPILE